MADPTREELMNILTAAIAQSHVDDPNRPDGTTWDNTYLSVEEAAHYAKAVLTVLEKSHLKIVTTK
jgi:hypothetical protein